MHRKLNLKKIISVIIVITFGTSLLTLFLTQKSINKTDTNITKYTFNYDIQLRKFSEQFKTEDPKSVYHQLVLNTANLPFSKRHDLAHVFGRALYLARGVSGVSLCDANLSFGCYHGLFSEAVTEEGLSIVPFLDKSCRDAGLNLYTGCQHGIGHGLVEYFGREKISEALDQCKRIQKNLLVGCSSGVFMEYFTPNPPTYDNKDKLLDAADPFKPCRPIKSPFVNSCILEIPRLWRQTGTDMNKFSDNCLRLNHPDQQRECFRGLGYITINTSNPDPTVSESFCNKMPDKQKELFCLAGATWGYRTIDRTKTTIEAIKTLCDFSNNKEECIKLSNFKLEQI